MNFQQIAIKHRPATRNFDMIAIRAHGIEPIISSFGIGGKRHDLVVICSEISKSHKAGAQRYYQRITNGGRLEYALNWFYATVNAYYQYGQTANSKKIRAYYFQPEISANTGKTLFRLGAEILSGNKAQLLRKHSRPLYCSTEWRGDAHLFYSQYPLPAEDKEMGGKYLGFESDLSLNYKPVKALEFIFGFSFTLADKRMELLKKVPDSSKMPVWSYLMISYTPRLLSRKWWELN